MNTTPPRFNSPLPKYVSIDFLFYRWGFDNYGARRRQHFAEAINRFISDEGLVTRLSLSRPFHLPNERREFWFVVAVSMENFSIREFRKYLLRGARTEPPYEIHEHMRLLWFNPDNKPKIDFYNAQNCYFGDSDFPEVYCLIKENSCVFFGHKGEGEGSEMLCVTGNHIAFHDEYEAALLPNLKELPHSVIYFERDNVRAVEQKTGFYQHNLSDEQLEQFAPTPTDEEKAKHTNKRGKHLKYFVKTLNEEQQELTVLAYKEAKRQHPEDRTKTSRLTTAAEIVTEKEGKKISYKGVEARLLSFGYSNW
jgi:hypothetical protein